MKVAPSPAPRSESDGRPRRRSPIAAVLPALLAIAGLALASSPAAAAEPAPAADGADGTAGLVPAALLLVVAGVVALIARRVTGPHAD